MVIEGHRRSWKVKEDQGRLWMEFRDCFPETYNIFTVVQLLMECAVIYMEFRDCFLRSIILLQL